MKLFKSLPFYKRSNYSTACNNLSLTTHLQKRSFKKKEKEVNTVVCSDDEFVAVANGTLVPLENVSDPAFASKMMGDGIAIELSEGTICAPCNGTLDVAYPTGHAFGITRNDGVEMIIHIGVNTVESNGKGFEVLATQGQTVKAGDPLVKVDLKSLSKKYDMVTMLIVTDPNEKEISFIDCQEVKKGQIISK